MLAGLFLSVAVLPGTGLAAGQISPGDVTQEDWTIAKPTENVLIGDAGTYNIKTPSGGLNVTSVYNASQMLRASKNGDITINGDIHFTSRDVRSHDLVLGGTGTTITLNGDFTADIHNSLPINVNPDWAPRGIQIMEKNMAGSKIVFNGDFTFHVYNDMEPDKADNSYTVIAVMSRGTEIDVNGNVDIENTVDHYDRGYGGANALYAEHDSTLNVTGDSVVLKTIGWRPHAISAKDGAVVNINADKLQVVGIIDMTEDDDPATAKGGTLNAVFSGSDSYWYGDEINVNGTGKLNVTFRDGAVYMPFGTVKDVGYSAPYYPSNPYGAKKYVSSLTLEDGGIVDLFDEDAQTRWEAVGLEERYKALKTAQLDYLLIDDLKGQNGVFRLDMNDRDKSQTDMIYILDSTEGTGLHHIEAYNDNNFGAVSYDNPLRFATVAAPAADKLIFRDKMNIYGNSLWDYNVQIGHSPYDVNDPENAIYNGSRDGLTADQINQLMAGGMNWFIYGMERTPSDNARIVMDGMDAGYDLATLPDRYNKRHGEARFLDPESPVWVRLRRGDLGRDSGYDGNYWSGQMGLESGHEGNHYGFAAERLEGKSYLTRQNGRLETTRKGLMLYDTLTWKDDSYLDLVACYDKLDYDLNGHNRHTGKRVAGDFSQHTYTLSAEYGKKFRTGGQGIFWEPQAQLQYTRLSGSDFRTSNGFTVQADSADSLIGRLGFRVGRDFGSRGTVYAKADVLREFTGGQDYRIRSYDSSLKDSVDKRGTWYDLGLGADFALSRAASLTCDLERSFGGDVGNNWEVNLGAKWGF